MLMQYQMYDIAKYSLAARNAQRAGAWMASRTRIERSNHVSRVVAFVKNLLGEAPRPRASMRFTPGGSPAR